MKRNVKTVMVNNSTNVELIEHKPLHYSSLTFEHKPLHYSSLTFCNDNKSVTTVSKQDTKGFTN